MEAQVNFLAILVAGIVNMAVGAMWYSPLMFGKQWMAMTGKTKEDLKKGASAMPCLLMFLASLVIAITLSVVVYWMHLRGFGSGAWLGVKLWGGFCATTMLGDYLYERRSLQLYSLNALYYAVTFPIMGGLIAAWR